MLLQEVSSTFSPKPFREDLHDALVARAKVLRPLLERNAAEHERIGELTPEVVDALDKAEFFKMSMPLRWGGLCCSSYTMAHVAAELAKGCPSSAWVVSIVNSCNWLGSTMSDEMQRVLFSDGIPRICGPSNGMGKVEQRGDEYVVNGKWAYGSASHHAQWALVPAQFADGTMCMTALPMSKIRIENSWQVAGMKGTGSDTAVAEDVVIGKANVCELVGVAVRDTSVPSAFASEATDFWVVFPLLRAKSMGVLLGAVEGLLEAVIDCGDRGVILSTYSQRRDSAVWQAGIGRATAMIGIVRTIIDKHNRYNDAAAERGHVVTYAERARCRGECAAANQILTDTVELLMNLAGSSAFMLNNPIQRYWRDFSVGVRHVIGNIDLGYEVYGKQVLGIEPNVVAEAHV